MFCLFLRCYEKRENKVIVPHRHTKYDSFRIALLLINNFIDHFFDQTFHHISSTESTVIAVIADPSHPVVQIIIHIIISHPSFNRTPSASTSSGPRWNLVKVTFEESTTVVFSRELQHPMGPSGAVSIAKLQRCLKCLKESWICITQN